MQKLPLARSKNLVMQNAGKEVLLYDLETDRLFCLNESLTIVYQACDGTTTRAELARKHNLTDDFISLSLHELQKENLLGGEYVAYLGNFTRREMIRKIGLTGMAALPAIAALTAPHAAGAQSGNCFGQTCTFDDFTQSDCCNSNFRCLNSATPSTCSACITTGGRFAFAAPAADAAFCNAQASKNLCCDTGSATGDGSWCYCP